jgi:TfoX/Sxy family transcriptional regulator of competence genes
LPKIKIPLADKELENIFTSVLPNDPAVSVRKMFGNLAAFVNGNMFAGIYGQDLFVRLSEKESKELLEIEGAALFEPMKGRPMKGYVLIPRSWKNDQDTIRSWVSKSKIWTGKLPAKKKKARR